MFTFNNVTQSNFFPLLDSQIFNVLLILVFQIFNFLKNNYKNGVTI
jgi:hypothetical protein